jgi:hypothetical protein
MKILVCGGRNFEDRILLDRVLSELRQARPFDMVIHGDSRGADRLAGWWADRNGIQEVRCPAPWGVHGHGAGTMRNRAMLTLQPDLVVAFPGGRGTAHMVSIAKAAGIEVIQA